MNSSKYRRTNSTTISTQRILVDPSARKKAPTGKADRGG
jgi:hypothetical protein